MNQYQIIPFKDQFKVSKNGIAITVGSLEMCQKFIHFNSYLCNQGINPNNPTHPAYKKANNFAHRIWNSMSGSLIDSNYPVITLITK